MTASDDGLNSCVFLGAGGTQPALWVLRPVEEAAVRVAAMPPGHSVYAVDVDPDERLVAYGTHAGRVVLLRWPGSEGPADIQEVQSLVQGAPVLSVCLLGGSRVASTDTAGRCLLWQPLSAPYSPTPLDCDGGRICSLLRLPDGRMAGLSVAGRLLFWEADTGRLVRSLDVPKPPRKLALARLRYWPARDALVSPAAGGDIVACELGSLRVSALAAHHGELYALAVDGEQLYSVGREDGTFKTWERLDRGPSEECRAPRGIISCEVLGDASRRLLLVADRGDAALCELNAGSLRLLRHLEGRHYRTVTGPPPDAREALRQRRRLARAQELHAQIQAAAGSAPPEEIDALHRQLVELGFEAFSLGIRADEAAGREDLPAELRARHRLAQILPPGDHEGSQWLRRYAQLLEGAWRLAEAEQIRARLPEAPASEWLVKAARLTREEDWVVEADRPIPDLIEAATAVDSPFSGRWLLAGHHALSLPTPGLRGEEIIAKYDQVRAEDGRPGLPCARVGELGWLSRTELRRAETVLFDHPPGRTPPWPQLAIRILSDELHSVLVPSVLFDAGRPEPGEPAEEHNRRALSACREDRLEGEARLWQREVQSVVLRALRRLQTQARSAWPG